MRSIGEFTKLIFQFRIPICRRLDKKWGCIFHIPKQSRLLVTNEWEALKWRLKNNHFLYGFDNFFRIIHNLQNFKVFRRYPFFTKQLVFYPINKPCPVF